MRIINVVGARPNFMKVAPVHLALRQAGHEAFLVHTGQHYDATMSQVFFDELGMPVPDANLGVGSASHALQTARVMEAFEPVLQARQTDMVLVAGDVNSTIACALVAVKLGVRVAHLEAGLRSFDRSMPEEINRVLTDQISDILLTPSPDADENLAREGIASERIFRVGNAMIDSLLAHLAAARSRDTLEVLGLGPRSYGVLTLHRPSNVDDPAVLGRLLDAVLQIAAELPIVFPVHPRALQRIDDHGLAARLRSVPGLRPTKPLGYLEFLALEADAALVLTDSGGIQEETTVLGVPCLTLRENTERPITVSEGTNTIVGTDPEKILAAARAALAESTAAGSNSARAPDLWDGKTAERVVRVLTSSSPA